MDYQSIERRDVIKGIASAGIAGLAGCSNDSGGSNGTGTGGGGTGTTLRFAGWGDAAEQKSVTKGLNMFEKSRENVTVNYQNIPYDGYHQKLQTQISAQEAPDLFYLGQNYVGSFAANDLLINQGERFSDSFIEGFNNSILNQYRTADGGLYMMPYAMSPEAVGYNSKLLSQVGFDEFPKTWKDFKSALQALKKETEVKYPLLQEGQGSQVARIWFPWVFANGGQIMNEDNTKCVAAQDANVEALKYFRELREADLIGTVQEIPSTTGEAALVNKEVAMITGGGTIIANTKENYPDFYDQLGIGRPPRPSDGKFGNVIAGAGYSISTNTDNPEATLNLVKFMLKEGIKPYLKRGIALPVRTAHQENMSLFADDPRYQTMIDMTSDPRLGNQQWGPATTTVVSSLSAQLQGVMHGEVAPRDALKAVEDKVNSALQK